MQQSRAFVRSLSRAAEALESTRGLKICQEWAEKDGMSTWIVVRGIASVRQRLPLHGSGSKGEVVDSTKLVEHGEVYNTSHSVWIQEGRNERINCNGSAFLDKEVFVNGLMIHPVAGHTQRWKIRRRSGHDVFGGHRLMNHKNILSDKTIRQTCMGSGIHSWSVVRQQQQTEVKKDPFPTTGMPLGVAGSEGVDEKGKKSAAGMEKHSNHTMDFADAEECDEAMEDLEETRKRIRALSRPPPGHVSIQTRVKQGLSMASRAITLTVGFILSLPGRLFRFAALPTAEKRELMSGIWSSVKKEAKHYWLGTKLLGKDVRIASRLVSKVLQGKALTRRERQQLTRTTADIFRLVPMLIFVVVPFMELLLPVALKLFPNMLPSTFEDKLKREEDLKRRIGARLQVARFLQDTVAEMAGDMTRDRRGDTQTSAAELYDFMQRVRAGEQVATSDLLKFAKLFNDELTLDNLERVQLVSLCRFVGISPFGTDAFLRSRLRSHLQRIKEDDRDIQEEGLENLTEDELRQACRARGMRAPFGEGAAAFMRSQLEEWLDWSLNRSLPSSLLLLSRAFTVTAPVGREKGMDETSIRETLSTLPDEAVEDVELFSTREGEDKTEGLERRLDLLEREEEMIREEEESAVATELPVTAGRATAKELAATAAAAAVMQEAAASTLAEALERESQEERSAKEAAAREARMRKVLRALAALSASSGVATEREAFMSLVEKEIARLNSRLDHRGVGMIFTRGHLEVDRATLTEAWGQKRLEQRVEGILKRVEHELDEADTKIGDKMKMLDRDGDGIIGLDELQSALTFLKEQVGEEELRSILEKLAEVGPADAERRIDVNKLLDLAMEDLNNEYDGNEQMNFDAPSHYSESTGSRGQEN